MAPTLFAGKGCSGVIVVLVMQLMHFAERPGRSQHLLEKLKWGRLLLLCERDRLLLKRALAFAVRSD